MTAPTKKRVPGQIDAEKLLATALVDFVLLARGDGIAAPCHDAPRHIADWLERNGFEIVRRRTPE
jgi:hypothetical protein